MRRIPCSLALIVVWLCWTAATWAEDAKPDAARITALSPLAMSPGATVQVKLVGVKIDDATAVLLGDAALRPTTQPTTHPTSQPATQPTSAPVTEPVAEGLRAIIRAKGKVAVPKGMEAAQVGDASLDLEINLPKDFPNSELALALVMPKGNTAAVRVLVMPANGLADETEPNNGFRDAQEIEPGKSIRGVIASPGDVDVFRFTAKSGQKLAAEVLAHRRHSLLDSVLTLYDEHGSIIAENDDANDTDSLIQCTLPADGVYFLALSDADDRGNPGFSYLLSVKLDGP